MQYVIYFIMIYSFSDILTRIRVEIYDFMGVKGVLRNMIVV